MSLIRITALRLRQVFLLALGLAILQAPLFGQVPGAAGSSETMNAAMQKLFGGNTAFSARAEFRVADKNQKETDFVPMNYWALDGKTRMEIDLSQTKSAELPPTYLDTIKKFLMDQTVVIARPDKKVTYSIYPRAKAYAEVLYTKEQTNALETHYKLDRQPLGKETVDGHSCQKDKVTVLGDRGQRAEAIVWSATDLKDFPVQMQMIVDASTTVTVKFRDVKLASPDAKQFDPPSAFTKYDSAEALRDALLQKQAKK